MKDWLRRGWRMEEEIRTLQDAKDRAFEDACRTGKPMQADRVRCSGKNTSEDRFIRYSDLEKEMDRQIDKLLMIKEEIMRAINALDNGIYRQLLTKRYLECKTWEQIAVEMHYSYRQITNLHGRALLEIRRHVANIS